MHCSEYLWRWLTFAKNLVSPGYNSSSILGELPGNGKVSRCNACDSSHEHLRQFSLGSKTSGIQTHWKVKTSDSLFSIQPNRICIPQEIASGDCSNCSKASQASGTLTPPELKDLYFITSTLTFWILNFQLLFCSGYFWWNIWTHNLHTSNSHKLCIFAGHVGEDSDSQWLFEGTNTLLISYSSGVKVARPC